MRHSAVMVLVFLRRSWAPRSICTARSQKGFIPDTDNDQLYVNTEVAQGTGFPATAALTQRVAADSEKDPDIETFFASAGRSMFGGSTNGRMFVNLKPRRERKATAEQIANRLRPKLLGIPGIRAVVTLPPAIRIGGRMSRAAYEVTLQAPDTAMLYSEVGQVRAADGAACLSCRKSTATCRFERRA